ncbi:MAG: HAMP domain-containing histidine kinase, partial [Clostridiales Family XIII bacterium]|nr:HAMP domain-containing histidine kinase [Clostridiales Family XIII bacterium]
MGDRFVARLIASVLVAALTAGAAALILIGDERENWFRGEAGLGWVSVGDLVLDKPYFETDSFQFMVNNDMRRLVSLYEAYGLDPRKPDYRPEADPLAAKSFETIKRDIHRDICDIIRAEWFAYTKPAEPISADGNPDGTDAGAGEQPQPMSDFGDPATAYRRIVSDGGEPESENSVVFDIPAAILDPALVRERTFRDGDHTITEREPLPFDAPGVKEAFEKRYGKQLAQVRESFDKERLRGFGAEIAPLESGDILYFMGNDQTSIANVPLNGARHPGERSAFASAPAHFIFERGSVRETPEGVWDRDGLSEDMSVFLAYGRETIASRTEAMTQMRTSVRQHFIPALCMMAAVLILLIWLSAATGRKGADGTRRLYALDRIFAELQAVLIFFVLFVSANAGREFEGGLRAVLRDHGFDFSKGNTLLYFIAFTGLIALCAAILLWFFLSIVRLIKSGLLPKRSLVWLTLSLLRRAVVALLRTVKSGFDGRNPFAKTLLLVGLLCCASAFCGMLLPYAGVHSGPFVLLPLASVFALSLLFAHQRVRKYDRLQRGIGEISRGNLLWRIPVEETARSEFDELARRVNAIGSAANIAVQNELKNQRLKTDLISNVSHDLKTPLTSIITYTDLLKKEGLRSKNASGYLDIIDEKGRRLQKLTDDLFDAAKASSGTMPVRRERLDLLALLNQEIAEMAEGFAAAELEIIVNGKSCCVFADSRLLWRVVDNLLSNIRKYALP